MSEGICLTVEDIEKVAASRGLIAFYPLDHELTIDLDEVYSEFESYDGITASVLNSMQSNGYSVLSTLRTVSKSGKQHIYYRLNRDLDRMERIILQAALGSDRVREFLGMMRCQLGSEVDTVMFETPGQAELVKEWRARYEQ